MTVREALAYIKSELCGITDEAENEAKIILSYLLDEEIPKLLLSDKRLPKTQIDGIVAKRLEGNPIQYIIGKWWFYKSEFFVGEGVLIPRQDTETLVETAIELLKTKPSPKALDLCAGSGCIGISIAGELKNASVICLEKYDGAYFYLQKNIEHNKADNVKAVKYDVFDSPFGQFDLIVSNPPYIRKSDMDSLSKEVKREPDTALDGGEDGLDFYRVIANRWKSSLCSGGVLAFEVGFDQAEAVAQILEYEGFADISVRKDLSGIQRVVFGTLNSL